jgi:hypothetical protein
MLWTKVTVTALVAAGTLILTGGGTVAWKLAAVDLPAASAEPASESSLDKRKPGECYEAPDSKPSGSDV